MEVSVRPPGERMNTSFFVGLCSPHGRESGRGLYPPEAPMTDQEPPKRAPGGTMRLAGAGVELAATLTGACLLGYWIDRRFDSSPWGLLICAAIGIVGGLYNMIRRSVKEMAAQTGRQKDKRGKEPKDSGNG